MAAVGFVAHAHREGAIVLAEETAAWLRKQGHSAELLDRHDLPEAARPSSVSDLDLAVSLGGDGTMLRAVDRVSTAGVPVLGVNVGHLGYLTAVEPAYLREALTRFLDGDYQVESRMTLEISLLDSACPGSGPLLRRSALNDLVLQRSRGGHTVRLGVAVNREPFVTFVADALIVATPTGSTAYNLSARGPIVSPRARVQIVTPVAPHMLFDRSLVLAPEEEVGISPGDGQSVDLVIDGVLAGSLSPGQSLGCRPGRHDARLVTFGERDFHRILKRKFNLADR